MSPDCRSNQNRRFGLCNTRLLPAILLATVICRTASGQIYSISTVAGGALPLNIPGVSASLSRPAGIAVDKAGNVFIADAQENVVLRLDAATGILNPVAGNGTTGYVGDNGAAINAQLNQPEGVAVDAAGNLYIADSSNNAVRKVSNGVITTVAGNGTSGYSGDGGPATGAQLYHPWGIALDTAGNLYFADAYNNVVREVSNGVIATVAGHGTPGYSGDNGPATIAQLSQPQGLAVDATGNIYVADYFNNSIRKVSKGVITTVAAGSPGGLNNPVGVAVDSAGNVYIGDGVVYKVSNGVMTAFMEGLGAGGLAVDANGDLFVADTVGSIVYEVANGITTALAGNGADSFSGDNGPATSAQLGSDFFGGVAVDNAGNLYIADYDSNRVRKVSNGVIVTIAGNGTRSVRSSSNGDTGPATSASISPAGIAVDASGNVYATDPGTNSVRRISNGVITTVAGINEAGFYGDNGPATSAILNTPTGVAVDAAGNLYIADRENNRVRKVSNGVITTVAGNGVQGFSGDGGPATSAMLNYPDDVAVDSAGNLYIADYCRIRKVSSGIITTLAGNGTEGFSGDNGPAVSALLDDVNGGIALDAAGNLFIADFYNNRIRVISNGVITTVAGGGTQGFADNGPATDAELNHPGDVALDSAGNVYLYDSINNRVRLLSTNMRPSITQGGIVPVYSSVSSIQAGSWVSIYGANLANGTYLWNNDFPQSLGGTTVTIDSKPAYLWFVSPTQINLQVPDDAATGLVSAVVNAPSGSVASTVTLSAFSPSFSLLGDGKHVAGEILTPNGYDLVGPSGTFSYSTRPVKPGETLVLYGVGFGPTTPTVPAGQVYSASAPTTNKVAISIGGVAANVAYSGITEEGLYQFNMTVPPAPGGDQPIQATVNGVQTPLGPVVTMQ